MSNNNSRPPATIELKRHREEASNHGIDYEIWERLYGRTLTDGEKVEIKTNMVDFFTTLIQASERITNGHKKDKRPVPE